MEIPNPSRNPEGAEGSEDVVVSRDGQKGPGPSHAILNFMSIIYFMSILCLFQYEKIERGKNPAIRIPV